MEQRRTALLIATDKYEDPAFTQLKAPANDVTRLGEVLSDPEVGAFTVRALLNKPHYVVRREISRICAEAALGDLVLFYVSGHGIKEEGRGTLHFVTTDTIRDHLRTSSVEAQLIRDEIEQSRARQAIVWLDCCYSGAFPTGGSPKSAMDADVLSQMKMEGRGTFVMTASTHIQYAYEPHRDAKAVGANQVSVFTKAIVEGLRTGAADVDGDGEIGTADLYEYVYQHVRAHTPNQTPTRNDQASGELLVARNKFALRLPAGLAPNIRNLLRDPDPKMRQLAIDHLGNEARKGDMVALESLVTLRSNPDLGLAAAARKALDTPPPKHAMPPPVEPAPEQPQPIRAEPPKRRRPPPPTNTRRRVPMTPDGREVPRRQPREPGSPQSPRPSSSSHQPERPPSRRMTAADRERARERLDQAMKQRRATSERPPWISIPVQGKPKIAEWRAVLGGLEVGVIVGPLGYMSFSHEGSGPLTTVLWVATVLVAGAALLNLMRLLSKLFGDVSIVLHRTESWPHPEVVFSPDGDLLAGHGTVWDTDTWREDDEDPGPRRRVIYSPDDEVIAEISTSGEVSFSGFEPRTRRMVAAGNAVAFGPEGRLAAIAQESGVIVIRVDSGDVVAALGCTLHGQLMTFDPTGRFLALSARRLGREETVFYETTRWGLVDLPPEITRSPVFAFNHDGSILAVTTKNSTVDLWRVADWQKTGSLHGRAQPTCIDFSADGKSIAVGDRHGRITLYSTTSWLSYRSMGWHHSIVSAVRFSPECNILASTGKDRSLRLWEAV